MLSIGYRLPVDGRILKIKNDNSESNNHLNKLSIEVALVSNESKPKRLHLVFVN